MHRIDSAGTAVALPTPGAVGATVGYFTDGDPGGAIPATVVSEDWLNAVQEELVGVIVAAGLSPDKTSQTQLLAAIRAIASGLGSGVLSKAFADTGYVAVIGARIVQWNTSGGNCVQNLPAASGVAGQRWIFLKTTGDANTVTLTPNGSEKINNDASLAIDTQYSSVELMSIGTGWILL